MSKKYGIVIILFLMVIGSQAQIKNTVFYCDSILYNEVVWPKDWNHLPDAYKFVAFDTLWKSGQKTNCKLVKDGKAIAFGNRKGNEEITGAWAVLSNTSHAVDFCIWGRIEKGIKKKRWVGQDGFFID